MDFQSLLHVGDLPGFTPGIARLVSMMNWVRFTTVELVEGMTVEQLDYLHDAESNSIGALLLHAAAVEFEYAATLFEGRSLTAEEMIEWEPALELGELGRRKIGGNSIDFYLERLERVRTNTLQELRKRDDAWLDEEIPFWGEHKANLHFIWFHVFEDELNHRGQMRWLKSRAVKAFPNRGG